MNGALLKSGFGELAEGFAFRQLTDTTFFPRPGAGAGFLKRWTRRTLRSDEYHTLPPGMRVFHEFCLRTCQ